MRKRLRRIRFIVVLLVVLAVAGVMGVGLLADKAVQTAVETAGTKTLNVGVKVGKADVAVLRGAVDIQKINVANPAGFEGSALLTLERVNIAADTRSLLSDEVRIKALRLANMEVFVEQKALRNNLHEVIKPLREPREPTGKRLVIDTLEIAGITVHASLSGIPGKPASVQFTLKNITMTDIGRNEKVDTAVLISKIILAVAASVAEQGGDILPPETVGEITGMVDKAIDLGKTVTEGLKSILGGDKKK